MNPGGEPERDEYGLPPVDVEIPDDARELDRDVQAYYRELRAARRRQRRHRLHLSLARDGIVLPLLACCLILALITGTLLTVFTATSGEDQPPLPGTSQHPARQSGSSGSNSPAHHPSPGSSQPSQAAKPPSSSASPAKSGARSGAAALIPGPSVNEVSASLPAGNLEMGSQAVPLRSLSGAMLILLTPGCRCAKTVSWLVGVGASISAPVFIVSAPDTVTEASAYDAQLSPALRRRVSVVSDTQGVLYATYPLMSRLVAVLVGGQSGPVFYAQQLSRGENPRPLTRAIES